jgi:hypothetical protein
MGCSRGLAFTDLVAANANLSFAAVVVAAWTTTAGEPRIIPRFAGAPAAAAEERAARTLC